MYEEQAYLLIADHLIGKLWHVSYGGNNPHLNWQRIWSICHNKLNVQNKYVVMDRGGKMDWNSTIVSIFDKYGCAVIWTASEAYHLNSPAEAPHKYIG